MAETQPTHQLVRTAGSTDRGSIAPVSAQRENSSVHDRQCDHSLVSEQAGGTRSWSLLKLSMRILKLAHKLQLTIVPRHIAGQLNVLADLASRSGTSGTIGVVPLTSHVPVGVQSVALGTTADRHVRKQPKSQAKRIHIPVPGLASDSSGCSKLPVASKGDVRVSSNLHSPAVPCV